MYVEVLYCRNPTPEDSLILENVKWPAYSKTSPKYLEIGNDLLIKENFREDKYREWERLFPLSNYI